MPLVKLELEREREIYSDEISEMLGDDLYGVLDAAVGHRHLLPSGSSLRDAGNKQQRSSCRPVVASFSPLFTLLPPIIPLP